MVSLTLKEIAYKLLTVYIVIYGSRRPNVLEWSKRLSSEQYCCCVSDRGRGVTRPIASVKPMVSTPVPMRPKIVAAPQILKPGVSVHQVLTTTGNSRHFLNIVLKFQLTNYGHINVVQYNL